MASSGSDTEMDSGSSSGYSSSCDASPAASPRQAAEPAGPPAAPRPGLRVPPLSLRANLADLPRDVGAGCDNAPSTARHTSTGAVGGPRLAVPSRPAAGDAGAAAASPLHTSRNLPSMRGPTPEPNQQDQQQQNHQQQAAAPPPPPPPHQPASDAPPLSLDILSPALTLQPSQLQGCSPCTSQMQLAQHCASQLGVPPERLRFFALSEVAGPQQLPPGCSRAAIEVADSSECAAASGASQHQTRRSQVSVIQVAPAPACLSSFTHDACLPSLHPAQASHWPPWRS